MLKIFVKGREAYDSASNRFVYTKDATLILEHSLLSISKWESIHKKCFLNSVEKGSEHPITPEEFLDYIRCMTINSNVDAEVYTALSKDNIEEIIRYMNDPMCATVISRFKRNASAGSRRRKDTAEVIYYYMITAGIPIECEKWHINRLLALIDVCATLGGGKKMTQAETASMYAALNQARRSQSGSSG